MGDVKNTRENKMKNKRNDVYENCPVLENDYFCLRLIEEKDAANLLETYSDQKALPFFNSDNCNDSNFYYETVEGMLEAIKYWLWEYERRGFVRFAIVDKRSHKVVGTIELFNRQAEDAFSNCGLLRLDVKSSYEEKESIGEILSIIVEHIYELFDCTRIATKAPIYAVERIEALKKIGFERSKEYLVGQHDQRRYYDYWVLEK